MRARFPATVHLLLFRGAEVLLLRRLNTGYRDGEYSLPAGHLDGGETVIAAGVREASEEIGVQIPPEALTFSSVMHRHEGEERIDFFLVVERWEGEPYNAEPEKCDDLRWVSLSFLPLNTIPYVRRALENHRDGKRFDEFGWDGPRPAAV